MPRAPVRFRIASVELFERDVTLRLPFRFGAATLTSCPQAFVRARIAFTDGAVATGAAAELMVPKWFDKSPAKSAGENVADLRRSLFAASEAYSGDPTPRPAFGHYASHYAELIEAAARAGINPLTACYGPALLDRAILDALCRQLGVSFYIAVRDNLPCIDTALTPDLAGFALDDFLASLTPRPSIAARHTVGLVDPITSADVVHRVDDGLPQTLEEVIATYGNRYFKIKTGGDLEADRSRLSRIAAVLDALPDAYRVTLDGNEQYRDVSDIVALWRALAADPALARFTASILSIEQPLARELTFAYSIAPLAAVKPVLIDEADATLDAFPRARALGYTGASSKACKGFYKSILNAARVARWNRDAANAHHFLSAEDLTTQAGLAVQQDLALVNLLGIGHVERNGHHYVNGFAGQGAGLREQRDFLTAHPGLYETSHGAVRLAVHEGTIDLRSLDVPGFACAASPDWSSLSPLARPPVPQPLEKLTCKP
jgi:L-alanine-DL-glutamate epimerase-like enolase superfamily enzyme